MRKVTSFIVSVRDGRIFFRSEAHKRMWERFLSQFEGEHRIEISTKTEKRSDRINRYYWVYMGMVADETGFTPDELHEYFKGKYLTTKTLVMYGRDVSVAGSTTEQTNGQFCEYLACILSETGVALPDTKEVLGYSYHSLAYEKDK